MDIRKTAQYYWESRVLGIVLAILLGFNALMKIHNNEADKYGNHWLSYLTIGAMAIIIIRNVYQIIKYQPYQKAYGNSKN